MKCLTRRNTKEILLTPVFPTGKFPPTLYIKNLGLFSHALYIVRICIDERFTLVYFFVSIQTMLKIRLERVGRVHEPSFRLVLTDSKNSSKSGRFLEILGSYDPRKSTDSLDAERIKYWISNGAQPTDTVHNLLLKHKIVVGKKINVSAKSKKAPVVKDAIVEPASVQDSGVAKEDVIVEPVVEPAYVENSGVAMEEKVETV